MASIHSRTFAEPGTEYTMVSKKGATHHCRTGGEGERAGNDKRDGAVQAARGTRIQEGLHHTQGLLRGW